MNKATGMVIFLLGAAVGSVVTWKLVKDRYAQIAQEEIDSVKEVFAKRNSNNHKNNISKSDAKDDETTKQKSSMESIAKTYRSEYTPYSNSETDQKDADNMNEDRPCVIPPDEFGEDLDYDQISLTFYSDQLIADDNDEIIEDVDKVIGFESLNHFGEYEDEAVYVRNDRLKCYYEILLDKRRYTDVLKEKPYLRS